MAPFTLRCSACGEYISKGRTFNARKEIIDEKYLSIRIFRFYIRCTRCSAEISFKTDPQNADYTCETGAERVHKPQRKLETVEERVTRLGQEEQEDLIDNRNTMETLEAKMENSKQEMAVADALVLGMQG
jgi:hypothetical protein